ncbi:MAG: hypothetical protein CL685_00695 [Candidatus Magasanikbacteria bacterium]|nr:hypothetical protein [Candidatus Magasanikbacteria bacterium]
MKIAIIGTHSTGKTSIIRQLSLGLQEKGKRVFVVSELSRLAPGEINEGAKIETQLWIQQKQKEEELKYALYNGHVLCDRSTVDNFAYLQRIANGVDVSEIEKEAVRHMQTYDFVFKTKKLSLAAVDDGIRSVDDVFRDDIERRIELLLKKHDISFYHLPETLEYKKIVRYIEEVAGLRQ